jgi:DNA-directed RNA polymerase subunit RPC12/RpoP
MVISMMKKMDIYCMWCGERLDTEDGHALCASCGTDYSSLVISESEVALEGEIITERSVCMDCTQIKRPFPPVVPLEVEVSPTLTGVPVYP